MTTACILGCAGAALLPEERALFRDVRPWGFILFRRNITDADQVRRLASSMREAIDDENSPILLDQEGGRVQRLAPPHWRRYPPAGAYGAAGTSDLDRRGLAWLGGRLIAHDMSLLGLNVNCAPVLDVSAGPDDGIVGDRGFGASPHEAAMLGRAFAEGLIGGGVLPVIKHVPGHGRGLADSHHELPIVDCSVAELESRDLLPFRALSDMPMAMTAHVLFTAVDRQRPATTSRRVVKRLIRGAAGFSGLLLTDDLSMNALAGSLSERVGGALSAGCDIALHCNGVFDEMVAVAAAAGALVGESKRRAVAARRRVPKQSEPFDVAAALHTFDAAFPRRLAA